MLLPISIKKKIIVQYVFQDIIEYNPRFFQSDLINDKEFIYQILLGLQPRCFFADCTEDKIICGEDEEVTEMLFV